MTYNREASKKNFITYVILNYGMMKGVDFDTMRDFLQRAGIVELLEKYTDPWVSHNQKWREAKIDRVLAVRGISLEKELQNG